MAVIPLFSGFFRNGKRQKYVTYSEIRVGHREKSCDYQVKVGRVNSCNFIHPCAAKRFVRAGTGWFLPVWI